MYIHIHSTTTPTSPTKGEYFTLFIMMNSKGYGMKLLKILPVNTFVKA